MSPPCRVVDTRGAQGPFGGPPLAAQETRSFTIPQGACGIPNTAAAYAFNVTVAIPLGGQLRYLTVWPTGQSQPNISTLNSLDGRTKANAAVVPAGVDGAVSVYATDPTNVILDVTGYFVPATTSTWAFFPLTPCRIADTRGSNGTFGGPYIPGGQQRIYPVLASACQIPASAAAYSLNFTALPRTNRLGYLTVWPTPPSPGTPPTVSTLNAPTGTATANAALIPGGNQGAVSVYATDDTDLLIDINGYFALSTAEPQPLSLYTLPPCRVLDTRGGAGAFSGTLPVLVLASPCSVPSAEAYVLNATVIPKNHGLFGYLSLWPDAEGMPVVSTLNARDGWIASNMAIVPTLNGAVDAYNSNPADLLVDIFSYFAPIGRLMITTSALPSGAVNYPYAITLTASGGVMPYTWSIVTGSLPPGLNLDPASGTISGTPTISQDYPFEVGVADSEGTEQTAVQQLDINVTATLQQLSITTSTLPAGTQNVAYNAMVTASGGVTPYTWSVFSGSLPAGLHLNSSTGLISGTPNGGGISNFTVQVTDSNTPAGTARQALSITITPAVPLQITTSTLMDGVAGSFYSTQLTAIGGVYPYTWSNIGNLPSGLTLNASSGVISGTPIVVGTTSFTAVVNDSETPVASAQKQLSLTIDSPGGNGNPALLSGNYAFYLNGFNASTPWTLAGSFISDGHGNITSGVVDGNSITGQPYTANVTGTYSISTAGLNLVTLQGSGFGAMTFAFDLNSGGNGRIIEYDDTTGQGSRGAGELRKADSSAFALNSLNGGWTFGITGASKHNGGQVYRFVDVGQFSLQNGSMTNGTCDTNDGGTYSTCTYSGTVGAVNQQSGRATVSGQSSNGSFHDAVYVVSSSEMIMAQTDAGASGYPIGVGDVEQKSGSFSSASLSGPGVLIMQSIHNRDGLDQSAAAIVSFDGHGNFNISAMDEDLAGTITQDQPQQGTYTVQSNGAVSFNCVDGGCPSGFLFAPNKAMLIGTGSNTMYGQAGPQSSGPFSNASISGNYAGGSMVPLDYQDSQNELTLAAADGAGNLSVTGDSSSIDGLNQYFGTQVNYTITANGRGTAIAQGDTAPSVVYVVSPSLFVVMMPSPDAELSLFQH